MELVAYINKEVDPFLKQKANNIKNIQTINVEEKLVKKSSFLILGKSSPTNKCIALLMMAPPTNPEMIFDTLDKLFDRYFFFAGILFFDFNPM